VWQAVSPPKSSQPEKISGVSSTGFACEALKLMNDRIPASVPDDPPPVLGTWARVYLFVLCYLALLIALFYLFTRRLAP
jgi:hypothetical protein